jgi:hypothetical protein
VLLAQTSTSRQDAALFAEMLSLPIDGRYPGLELTPRTAPAEKPPTAKPKIIAPTTNRQQHQHRQPARLEFTKPQLHAMLAEAVRNT